MSKDKKDKQDLKFDDNVIYVSSEGIRFIEQAISNIEKAQTELKKVAEANDYISNISTRKKE